MHEIVKTKKDVPKKHNCLLSCQCLYKSSGCYVQRNWKFLSDLSSNITQVTSQFQNSHDYQWKITAPP